MHLRDAESNEVLMNTMSPALQAEVSWCVNHRWLKSIWFLKGAPFGFLVPLSRHIRPHVFAPSEAAPPGHLFIVKTGLVLYGGRVLGPSKVWGEDTCILASEKLRSTYTARAMTFVECCVLKLTVKVK